MHDAKVWNWLLSQVLNYLVGTMFNAVFYMDVLSIV
jgi:hypothetical protein